jgi:hypothetical protein
MGVLEAVWKIRDDKSRVQIIGKPPINVHFGKYIFVIGGIEYETMRNTPTHADVNVITSFSGAPASSGVFIAGENTTRRHLYCAAKYCLSNMKIYTMPKVYINEIKDGNTRPPNTDLINKLSLVRFK